MYGHCPITLTIIVNSICEVLVFKLGQAWRPVQIDSFGMGIVKTRP